MLSVGDETFISSHELTLEEVGYYTTITTTKIDKQRGIHLIH